MKEYFLLFTACFIAFEACLIAGSSSSYGMEHLTLQDVYRVSCTAKPYTSLLNEESPIWNIIAKQYHYPVRTVYTKNNFKRNHWYFKNLFMHGEDPAADNRLQRYGKAPITILLGTSTSGKTTLIDLIKTNYPMIKDYSEDFRFPIYGGNLIKNSCLTEYNIINAVVPHEEIFNVLAGNKIKSRNYLPEQLELAEQALQKINDEELFEFDDEKFDWALRREKETDQLILDSMRGVPIILDHTKLWGISQIFSRNFYADVNIVITFCPLRELSTRLKQRNEEAEQFQQFTNMREVEDLLGQFTELYKKRENHTEPLLQILTRREALDAFRLHVTNSKQEKKFLKSLGFTSPEIDTVEITTRAPYYHSILNTKTHVYARMR